VQNDRAKIKDSEFLYCLGFDTRDLDSAP